MGELVYIRFLLLFCLEEVSFLFFSEVYFGEGFRVELFYFFGGKGSVGGIFFV